MNWDESFKDYAVKIANIYQAHPAGLIQSLRLGSIAGCLNESYLSLVREKELAPIENIDPLVKTRIWNRAKELTEDQKQRIEISRSIYLLEELTK